MAIKISGVTVIDDSRELVNVTSATITNGTLEFVGTGRILGITSVVAPTDATSKTYVDELIAAVEELALSARTPFSAF